eukprot:CAMPEP_0172330470 /NCGR_PEP_ID=MMETSP1058-20130122/61415_1 /TAXON_ID=83371 /ORGANISM="Detonula confervacea, Strain CCMP 353" /LENGTH=431 /DNA_ID=CAMNT_0013047685 /DNA_START=173 /DNA_END=1465 /DNA_ORIENTATION=-
MKYYSDQGTIKIESSSLQTSKSIHSTDEPIHILITVCNGGNDEDTQSMIRYRETDGLLRTIQRYGMQTPSETIIVHVFTDDVSTLNENFLKSSSTSRLIDRLDVRVYKMPQSMIRYRETDGLLRTIQRYGMQTPSETIIVHVFTDDVSTLNENFLKSSSTSRLIDRLDVRVYKMPLQPSASDNYHRFRRCASARLYAPYLFQSTITGYEGGAGDSSNSSSVDPLPDRILYLDTDTLVTTPLRRLWESATTMFDEHPNALFAMAQECGLDQHAIMGGYDTAYRGYAGENVTVDGKPQLIYTLPAGTCRGYNSGVLFVHLHRWQTQDFSSMVLEQGSYARDHNYEDKMLYGDQGILNAIAARFPERLLELPCFWNMRSDSVPYCLPRYIENGGGILHGNKRKFYTTPHAKLLHDFLVGDNDTISFEDYSISRW